MAIQKYCHSEVTNTIYIQATTKWNPVPTNSIAAKLLNCHTDAVNINKYLIN